MLFNNKNIQKNCSQFQTFSIPKLCIRSIKHIKHYTPLFKHYTFAVPLKNQYSPPKSHKEQYKENCKLQYLLLKNQDDQGENENQQDENLNVLFEENQNLCKVGQVVDTIEGCSQQAEPQRNQSDVPPSELSQFIELRGQNLWDWYRAHKHQQTILTQEEIWYLLRDIVSALISLKQHGYSHKHLRQYAIYRVSPKEYQLIFHSKMSSMKELACGGKFYWYDFYLSPEDLQVKKEEESKESILEQQISNSIFSLGLLVLNVMNPMDYGRDVYKRKQYGLDHSVLNWKLKNARGRYSQPLIQIISQCLKYRSQRILLKQLDIQIKQQHQRLNDRLLNTGIVVNELLKSKQKRNRQESLISSPSSSSFERKIGYNSPKVKNANHHKNSPTMRATKKNEIKFNVIKQQKQSPIRQSSSQSQEKKKSTTKKYASSQLQKAKKKNYSPQRIKKGCSSSPSPSHQQQSSKNNSSSKSCSPYNDLKVDSSSQQTVKKWFQSSRASMSQAKYSPSSQLNKDYSSDLLKTCPSSRQMTHPKQQFKNLFTNYRNGSQQVAESSESIKEQVPNNEEDQNEYDTYFNEKLFKSSSNHEKQKIVISQSYAKGQVQSLQNHGGKNLLSINRPQRIKDLQISFQRQTFGENSIQSPKFKNVLINKLSNKDQNQEEAKATRKNSQEQNFQSFYPQLQTKRKMISFGTDRKSIDQDYQKHDQNRLSHLKQDGPNEKQPQLRKQANQQLEIADQQHDFSPKVKINLNDAFFEQIWKQNQAQQLQLSQDLSAIKLTQSVCLKSSKQLQQIIGSATQGVWIEGDIYYGNFVSGRRAGLGLELFPEKQYYFGNFKDDLFHGEGFYFWNKHDYFLGRFENGRKMIGKLQGRKLVYSGHFNGNRKMNGFGIAQYKSGQIFSGEWKDGKKHGKGVLTQVTGDKFAGIWQKGLKKGNGVYVSKGFPKEGYRMKGYWQKNQVVSRVRIQFSNGNLYQGTIKDLQMHGHGEYIYIKGDRFKGTFYHNEPTHGQLSYKNGEKYIGSLRKMKRHGYGQYHYLDGSIKKGNWVDNLRVSK